MPQQPGVLPFLKLRNTEETGKRNDTLCGNALLAGDVYAVQPGILGAVSAQNRGSRGLLSQSDGGGTGYGAVCCWMPEFFKRGLLGAVGTGVRGAALQGH